ncbi:chloride channel protein [Streptococcus iniae]
MNSKSIQKLLYFFLALLIVSLTAGLVGSLLTVLIHFIQELSLGFQEGNFSQTITQTLPLRRVISLTLAGLLAGFGWYTLAKQNKPLVPISTVVLDNHIMYSRVNFIHGMLQLITVSMGSPVGREGASREVTVALSDAWIEKTPSIIRDKRNTLLACASGAALGAVYNAPFATTIFILETILISWKFKDILAATFSSFIAVFVVRLLLGDDIQYSLPLLQFNASLLIWSIFAGIFIALLAFGYQFALKKIPKRQLNEKSFILRALFAFLLVGVLSLYFPQILGNGKAGILFILHEKPSFIYALALFLAKAIAVWLVFFSGAYGGKIAPAMMLGGTAAALFAVLWNISPLPVVSLPFAIVIGAAVFLGLLNQMPLTAILFLPEITNQPFYNAIPIAIAVLSGLLVYKKLAKTELHSKS